MYFDLLVFPLWKRWNPRNAAFLIGQHSPKMFKANRCNLNNASFGYLVLTGLIQDVQGLHGNDLVVVMELGDQKLHAPAAEELHAGTQQHTEVFGGVQPACLVNE